MTELAIAVFSIAAFVVMFGQANARFRAHQRLPMQWSLSGIVGWTAPRRVALGFMPILGSIVILLTLALLTFLQPKAGQEALEAPALFLVSFTSIASYALHLWLIDRTISKGGQ